MCTIPALFLPPCAVCSPEDTNEGNEAWNTTTAAQLPSYAVGPLKHPFTVTMRFRSNKRNSY